MGGWQCESPSEAKDQKPDVTLDLPEHGHQVMRIFGKSTLWLLIDRVGLRIATMFAGLAMVGYLGPANFGLYSTVIALGALVNTFLDFGLTRYARRSVAAAPAEVAPILAISIVTTLGATIIEVLVIIYSLRHDNFYFACLGAAFIMANLEGTSLLCSGILTSLFRSRAVLPGALLNSIATIAVVTIVISYRLSVFQLLALLTTKSVAVLTVRLWQLRSSWPSRLSFTAAEVARALRNSWHYYSYSLTQMGYERVSIVGLGLVASQEQVGLFATALTLAGLFPTFTYAAADALLPVMTRLFETGRLEDLLAMRARLLNMLLFLCIPVGITLAAFAPQICHLLGSRFVPAAPVLRILAARSLLSVLDSFLGQGGLTAVGRIREQRNSQLFSLALAFTLTVGLGWLFSTPGAATAILIADTVLILGYLHVLRQIGLAVQFPSAFVSAVAGAIMAAVCFVIPRGIWPVAAASAILVYLAAWAIVGHRYLFDTARAFKECFISG